MAHITPPFSIIVGSVLGATEYVADAIKAACDELGFAANVYFEPKISDIDLNTTWIICTSTHGAGDLPDNIQPFHDALLSTSLSNTYYLIGLGDSSYDTYCGGAETIHHTMQQRGAAPLAEPKLIDVLHHPIPEDEAVSWFKAQLA
jgi:MioC protein